MSNNLNAKVTIDTATAKRAVRDLADATKLLASASNDAGNKITTGQRLAAKATVDSSTKIIAANDKQIASYRALAQAASLTVTKRAAINSGSKNAAAESGAKVDQINSKSADSAAESASRVVLLTNRAITEEKRQQIMLTESAARVSAMQAKTELNARKQIFREQQALNRAQDDGVTSLNGMRYVLADIGQSMRVVGLAAMALPAAAAATAVAWEKDFAGVIRTSGVGGDAASIDEASAAVGRLKGQFVQLVQTMPSSWGELTEIGTLAGQLGIAEEQVGSFTKTIAMFSATTDVSVNDSATAFGRLNSLVPDVRGNFTKLGDSILKVGVNSVATEGSIIRITTQIAAIAAPAGFSSEQIIGLSGALASIGVPPELSRGVITRVFGDINKSTANGGVALEKWGRQLGITGDQFRTAWNTDAAGTFQKFMTSLRLQGSAAALALNDLGITSVRDVPILMRLAGAADSAGRAGGLLAQTMSDAANATGEMQKQYNIISGTTAAKLQIFLQTFQSLIDAVGSAALPIFSDVLDGWTKSLRDVSRALKEPVTLLNAIELPWTLGEMLAVGVAISAGVGALALLTAGFARAVQGAIAMKVAMATMGWTKAAAGANATAAAVAGVGAASNVAAAPVGRFAKILPLLKGVGIAAAIGAIVVGIDLLMKSLDEVGSSAEQVSNALITAKTTAKLLGEVKIGAVNAPVDAGPQVPGGLGNPWGERTVGMREFKNGLMELEKVENGYWDMDTQRFARVNTTRELLQTLGDGYQKLIDAGNKDVVFTSVKNLQKDLGLSNDALSRMIYSTPALNALFKDTLSGAGLPVTEANLLSLGKGGFAELGIETEASRAAAEAFNAELEETQAATTSAIEALATASFAFLDFNSAINSATQDGIFSLTSFMSTLREQSAAQAEWQTNMGTLAASGISSSFLTHLQGLGPEAAVLIKEFAANPEALNEANQIWAQSGSEAATSWAANFQLKQDLAAQVGSAFGAEAGKSAMTAMNAAGDQLPAVVEKYNGMLRLHKLKPSVSVSDAEATINRFVEMQSRRIVTISVRTPTIYDKIPPRGGFTGGAFDTGGYTGDGGKYMPAGVVHKGEFVMTKEATSAIGVGNLYNLMRAGQKGYFSGGAVGGNSSKFVPSFGGSRGTNSLNAQNNIMQLSQHDRALLMRLGDVRLSLDGQLLAANNTSQAVRSTRKGTA